MTLNNRKNDLRIGQILCDTSGLVIPKSVQWDPPSNALDAWSKTDVKAIGRDDNVIDITDIIGEDPWTGEGFSEKKCAAILADVDENQAMTVNINSPGGSFYAGLAIHSRLKAHKGEITVNIVGIAASAASLIAMAGDKVNMYTGTMFMIHNAWSFVIGNRHDLTEAAKVFAKVDESQRSIYEARTGLSAKAIEVLMDGEGKNADGTYLTAEESVQKGFADSIVEFEEDQVSARVPDDVMARRETEAALAKAGHTRQERVKILNRISGERDATTPVERDADNNALFGLLMDLNSTMKPE